MVLIDSNILFDIWDRDPVWSVWSTEQLRTLSGLHEFAIDPVIYAEVSARFNTRGRLDERLADLQVVVREIPRDAAFLAGKAYVQYRRQGGTKNNVLPDFFIAAHAAVLGCPLLTRDTRNCTAYFPRVQLIAP
jgi:predicted nucleic acid-binding protein